MEITSSRLVRAQILRDLIQLISLPPTIKQQDLAEATVVTTIITTGTVTKCLVQTLMVVEPLYPISSNAEGAVIYSSNAMIVDRPQVETVGINREIRD